MPSMQGCNIAGSYAHQECYQACQHGKGHDHAFEMVCVALCVEWEQLVAMVQRSYEVTFCKDVILIQLQEDAPCFEAMISAAAFLSGVPSHEAHS